MVRIRLRRMGAKKRPFYRLVAAPQQSPRDGRFIEQLGYYDPMQEPLVLKLDLDRIDHWISVGAKPSDTAGKLIERYRKLSNEMAAAASATSEG